MTDDQKNECLRNNNPKPDPEQLKFGIETDKICFLITTDQKSLLPEPWYFPYSGQWNAYNPFQKIKEIEINNIAELTNLIFDVDDGE